LADAKRLAFVRQLHQTSIAIGDLTAIGRKDFSTVPFIQSEGWNNFLDWTADSKGVLFASERNGKWQIFLQSVGAEYARPLVARQAALGLSLTSVWGSGTRLNPDDRWLLYFVNNARDPAGKTQVLMRVAFRRRRCRANYQRSTRRDSRVLESERRLLRGSRANAGSEGGRLYSAESSQRTRARNCQNRCFLAAKRVTLQAG
jgi:Tol biopolymer transport system component